jgi:hypothetical protein
VATAGVSLLPRAVDRKIGLLPRVENGFTGARDAPGIGHQLSELLVQSIYR